MDCPPPQPDLPETEPAPPAKHVAPAAEHDTRETLRYRAPGSGVIAELLRLQSAAPTRSRMQRVFGRSPLTVDSRTWYLGALGELEVARVLDLLGPGWSAVHALPVGELGSDIDHLVIGPAGVYTVNAKFHQQASVWVGGKRILVNGRRTDHLRNAEFEARRAAKLLSLAAGRRVEVTPILAIVAARRITLRERPLHVLVTSSHDLPRLLLSRPPLLTGDEAAELHDLAATPATWGRATAPAADLGALADLRMSIERARGRRTAWKILGALALMFGPLVAVWAGMLNVAVWSSVF